ncbi:HVA22 TB2 DP1 family protein [Babesia ovis]|uniref:HVA22 TB2 DP1 family protein n=1 Tax=Babesia ovis TaxID=5869 RepID=A0A9W5TBY3_BABOV|nr:HVA22 TB2 DP1 family protein [Babesia ovis]
MTADDTATSPKSGKPSPKLTACFHSGSIDWTKLVAYLDYQAEAFPLMTSIARIVKLPPGIVLSISCFSVLVLFAVGKGTTMICDAAGLLYPGYKTYKVIKHFDANPAIRRAATEELSNAIGIDSSSPQEQLMFWAKYWVVYSIAFVFKYLLFAFFFWFPFFDLFKLCFAIAMFHPKLRGAEVVFNLVVFPILVQYEKRIDDALDFVDKKIGELVNQYSRHAMGAGLRAHLAKNDGKGKTSSSGK